MNDLVVLPVVLVLLAVATDQGRCRKVGGASLCRAPTTFRWL